MTTTSTQPDPTQTPASTGKPGNNGRGPSSGNSPSSAGRTQATKLVHLATRQSIQYFHTPDGREYARIPSGLGYYEIKLLRTRDFRNWMSMIYWQKNNATPSKGAIEDALGVLCGLALFEHDECPLNLRVGEHDGNLYVDLGDECWKAVEITSDGWSIIQDCPVHFWRPRGLKPLPIPEKGGSLDALYTYLNVKGYDRPLLISWILAAFRPKGPYPVLALYGEQGSGKSIAARMIKKLIDPSTSLVRSNPRDARDLAVGARNNWIIGFDNVSRIPSWLSDALCRLSTGGGYATRLLWSDDEEVVLEAQRPVIINGVTEMVTRPDLLERAIILELPSLADDDRQPENQIWSKFDKATPGILGGLFDALSTALANIGNVKLAKLPRMADFATWVAAAEPALGLDEGTILKLYKINQAKAEIDVLSMDPLITAIMDLLDMTMSKVWSGSATGLYAALQIDTRSIRSPRGLSASLKRLAPSLRRIGMHITWKRDMNQRKIIIEDKR